VSAVLDRGAACGCARVRRASVDSRGYPAVLSSPTSGLLRCVPVVDGRIVSVESHRPIRAVRRGTPSRARSRTALSQLLGSAR